MQNMKKKLTVILLIAGVLVMAYLYAHIDKNTYLYDRNTDSADLTGTGILEEKEELRSSHLSAPERTYLLSGLPGLRSFRHDPAGRERAYLPSVRKKRAVGRRNR